MAIVYHEVETFAGSRLVDQLRQSLQIRTMRLAHTLSDLAIFIVPPEKLSWLPTISPKAIFIPVGANLPITNITESPSSANDTPTIGVFSISGGGAGALKTNTLLRLCDTLPNNLIGSASRCWRHSELREVVLHKGLKDLPVELSVQAAQVVEKFLRVMFFSVVSFSTRCTKPA